MKKLLLILLLLAVACTGCVEKKIATQNAFYSTQAPALTIEFPDNVRFIGDKSTTREKILHKVYYYADREIEGYADRLSFFEIQTIPSRYYWEPKYLPVGSGPYTDIYKKSIDEESYYCRTFITNSDIGYYADFYKDHGVSLPEALDVLICTKKVSDTKKATFAYMRKADLTKFDNAFAYNNYNLEALTSEQIHYFNDIDKELSSEINVRKFQESDLQ